MEMKKFNSLSEFLLSEEFKKKDLSYCDLSGINLGMIPSLTWKGFIFNHTNFKDTNIKFYPQKLNADYNDWYEISVYSIEYCDFTNCDLGYLTTSDLSFTSIKGCNFTNTNLNVELLNSFGENIEYSWLKLGYKDYSDVIFPQNEEMYENIKKIGFLVNYNTIKNNPFIPFSSKDIFLVLKKELPGKNIYITNKNIEKLNNVIDQMLEEDRKREGKLVEFLGILNGNNNFSQIERIRFFQGIAENKDFSELDLSDIPSELITQIEFKKCNFEKIIFPQYFESNCDKMNLGDSLLPYVYFPTVNFSSWQSISDKRLGNTRITFYRNLYLELGRACNGNCKFCRNQYLEPCKYDLENIKKRLVEIAPHLDNIVIGGGEPTLLLDDINNLIQYLRDNKIYSSLRIFTNASLNLKQLMDIDRNYYFNISRHSVSDQVNNQILGVKALSVEELKKFFNHSVGSTLCATCFKGDGLDTVEKLEDYIALSDECKASSILFQTLHKDLNNPNQSMSVLPIEDEIFDEMIIKLKEQGYEIGAPIYSTGDYKLIIATNGGKTISFKKYISKDELEKEWYLACKRTFDLSMDPSGNVYENWHQSSDKVLIK